MRIIDADALRARYQAILDRGDMFCEYDIIGMVDNAPTVLHDNYSMGYQDGVKKVLSERPQGEWLHPYKSDIACECSNCHRQMPITNYYHFCPNCGVKMKKETENE